MRGKRRRSTAGFTLIEVLTGILILAIVITTTLGVFLERQKRLQMASETVLAYQALSNEAEIRRRINYTALEGAGPDFLSDVALLAPLAPFEAEAVVEEGTPGRKDVTLSVTWSQGKRTASLTLVRVDTGGSNLW